MTDYEIFDAGDTVLQSGATLRAAKLAYKTFGRLNGARDNAIVYPTWYSGQHYENEWLVAPIWRYHRTTISSSFPIC
jgi:homoserine O-acetyltransferase/O-succinyltransferase